MYVITLLGNLVVWCSDLITNYRTFPKYDQGVNYFQMASDQALNWTRRSFEIQKNSVINCKQFAWYQALIWTWALFWKFTVIRNQVQSNTIVLFCPLLSQILTVLYTKRLHVIPIPYYHHWKNNSVYQIRFSLWLLSISRTTYLFLFFVLFFFALIIIGTQKLLLVMAISYLWQLYL